MIKLKGSALHHLILFYFILSWASGCVHRGSCKGFYLSWPVNSARLSQDFRPPSNPKHEGLDLAAPKGSHIYAAHSGRVIFSGQKYRGYGKMVILKANTLWSTLYSHMMKISVKNGQKLRRGDLIGYVGQTGHASGPHLHFELLKNKQPISPLTLIRSNCPTK